MNQTRKGTIMSNTTEEIDRVVKEHNVSMNGLDRHTLERLSDIYHATYISDVKKFVEAVAEFKDCPMDYSKLIHCCHTMDSVKEAYIRHRCYWIHFNPVDTVKE